MTTTPSADVQAAAVEMIRRICPPHLDREAYGHLLAGHFDAHLVAVLREAADYADTLSQFDRASGARKAAQVSENVGILRVTDALRHMADEVQQAAPAVADTQPEAEGTLPPMSDRHTIDTITPDALDALYARVAKAEQEADAAVAAAAQLTILVGRRSEKAENAAVGQRKRAEIFETELRVLRSGLRANGADPTQIQNLWAQIRLRNRQWREAKQRAEQAEATIARVQALAPILDGLDHLIATSSRDWGEYRVDAWLWAVFVGWDCEEQHDHDETCDDGAAMAKQQQRHGWSDEAVAKARRFRAAVRAVAALDKQHPAIN